MTNMQLLYLIMLLYVIIQKFKLDFPQFMISKVIYKSNSTAQHFKQKYSICMAILQPGNTELYFTATDPLMELADLLNTEYKTLH